VGFSWRAAQNLRWRVSRTRLPLRWTTVQKCPRLPLFPDGTKKRPQRGAVALRPLQFRRPTGDLGGGPIGASPSTGKTQYGLIQAASAEKVPSTVFLISTCRVKNLGSAKVNLGARPCADRLVPGDCTVPDLTQCRLALFSLAASINIEKAYRSGRRSRRCSSRSCARLQFAGGISFRFM